MRCLQVSEKCEGCEMYRNRVRECLFKNTIKGLLTKNLSEREKSEKVSYLLKFLDA